MLHLPEILEKILTYIPVYNSNIRLVAIYWNSEMNIKTKEVIKLQKWYRAEGY